MDSTISTTKLLRPYSNVAYIVLQEKFSDAADLQDLQGIVELAYKPHVDASEAFILVFNTEYTQHASPFLIKEFAQWMNTKRDVSSSLLHCSIMIFSSAFTRTCFSVILSFYTPSRPYFIVDSVGAANIQLKASIKELKARQQIIQ